VRKFILIPLFTLLVLVFAVVVAPYFIPTNTYRGLIENKIASHFDAKVSMDSFHIRILPSPGYKIENFQLLSSNQPFPGLPILKIDEVEGSLSLKSLIGGNVKTGIKLRGATIDYRLKDGISNIGTMLGWHFSGIKAGGSVSVPEEEATEKQEPDEKNIEEIYEEIPIKAIPAMPSGDEDTSKFLDMIAKKAHAEDLPRSMQVFSETKKTPDFKIISLDVVDGKINSYDEDDLVSQLASKIDIAARNFSYTEGLSPAGFSEAIAANIRLNAAVLGSNVPNFSITGKIVYDGPRKEISTKAANLYLMGAQMSADASIGLGFNPSTFDLHLATAALNPLAIIGALPKSLAEFLFDLEWQGVAPADLKASGSFDSYELTLGLDATQSSVKKGNAFSKIAGAPLKIAASFKVSPDDVSIDSIELMFGQNKLNVSGKVEKKEGLPCTLRISGTGLSDSNIKPAFPDFIAVDSLEGLDAKIDAEGRLVGLKTFLNLVGNFKAVRAEIVGIALENLDVSFIRDETGISIPSISGTFASGKLTGNASIATEDKISYSFDGAVSELDFSRIKSLGGALRGRGTIIIKASTSGKDPLTLNDNLEISGTLTIPSGASSSMTFGRSIFATDTYKVLEALGGAKLNEAEKVVLSDVSDEFIDFNAEFNKTNTAVSLKAASWHSSKYTIEGLDAKLDMTTKVDTADSASTDVFLEKVLLSGTSLFIVPKGVITTLITDEGARGVLLDSQGRLILPVNVGGNLKKPGFIIDQVRFAKSVEAKEIKLEPSEVSPADIIRPEGGTEAPLDKKDEPSIKIAPQKSSSENEALKPKPKQRPKPQDPGEDKKPTEEILKVIIGE